VSFLGQKTNILCKKNHKSQTEWECHKSHALTGDHKPHVTLFVENKSHAILYNTVCFGHHAKVACFLLCYGTWYQSILYYK